MFSPYKRTLRTNDATLIIFTLKLPLTTFLQNSSTQLSIKILTRCSAFAFPVRDRKRTKDNGSISPAFPTNAVIIEESNKHNL